MGIARNVKEKRLVLTRKVFRPQVLLLLGERKKPARIEGKIKA